MNTQSQLQVAPLTAGERDALAALAESETLLTVTIPRHVLVALLDELDASERLAETWSAIAQEVAERGDATAHELGAVLKKAYAELNEAHAATLGELRGARSDLVDARARAGVLEDILGFRIPTPTPGTIERAIARLGDGTHPPEHWEDQVFAQLDPELDERAGHDFLDEDRG